MRPGIKKRERSVLQHGYGVRALNHGGCASQLLSVFFFQTNGSDKILYTIVPNKIQLMIILPYFAHEHGHQMWVINPLYETSPPDDLQKLGLRGGQVLRRHPGRSVSLCVAGPSGEVGWI